MTYEDQELIDQLVGLFFKQKEVWAKRVGSQQAGEFETEFLGWRRSSPEGTFSQAIFDHSVRRAKKEDVGTEEFVKRTFGPDHNTGHEAFTYFRG